MASTFFAAFIEAALWSSVDDNGTPLDSNHAADDFDPETLATLETQCDAWYTANEATIAAATCSRSGGDYSKEAQAGHDLWLTSAHHGAGFWDGDWSEPQGAILTQAARDFGQIDLYIGDNGRIFAS